jgi:hypothetical protein
MVHSPHGKQRSSATVFTYKVIVIGLVLAVLAYAGLFSLPIQTFDVRSITPVVYGFVSFRT